MSIKFYDNTTEFLNDEIISIEIKMNRSIYADFLHISFLMNIAASKPPKAAPYLFALTMKPAASLSILKPSTNADKNEPPKFT